MSLAEVVDEGPFEAGQPEEQWVQSTSNPEQQIRIRNLTVYLANGGQVTDARLVEGEDDRWTIHLRLANRSGEYRLNIYRSDQPKTYRDVRLAIETIRQEFGYAAAITLVTDKPVSRAQPGSLAETDEEE